MSDGPAFVGLPKDPSLPFFAYGIFRPDEIAWPRIVSFVESTDELKIDGWELRQRNGLPLAALRSDAKLSGHRVRFTDPRSAYVLIGNVEPSGEYKWVSVSDSTGENCNLLAAESPNKSTEPIDQWSSARDPLFQYGMEFVSGVIGEVAPRLAQIGPFGESSDDCKNYFEFQGAFLTLWSVFERYAAFRYGAEFLPDFKDRGNKKAHAVQKLWETAGSEKFSFAIANARIDEAFKVFSVLENKNKAVTLDGLLNPVKAAKAWYQVRSNLTHRGKSAFKENKILLTATIDLYNTLYFFLGDEVPGLNKQWGNRVQYISRQEILN